MQERGKIRGEREERREKELTCGVHCHVSATSAKQQN
jgi:hypothetical protein